MHDIPSLAHQLTAEGQKHYIVPPIICELTPVHPSQSGYHNAATVMVRERPLQSDVIDLVSALLMLRESANGSLHERMKALKVALDQLKCAQAIADDATRADIETSCSAVTADGREPATAEELRDCWYDLRQHLDVDAEFISTAAAYLDSRNLLQRHSDHPNLVRVGSAKQGRVSIAEAA